MCFYFCISVFSRFQVKNNEPCENEAKMMPNSQRLLKIKVSGTKIKAHYGQAMKTITSSNGALIHKKCQDYHLPIMAIINCNRHYHQPYMAIMNYNACK